MTISDELRAQYYDPKTPLNELAAKVFELPHADRIVLSIYISWCYEPAGEHLGPAATRVQWLVDFLHKNVPGFTEHLQRLHPEPEPTDEDRRLTE